MTLKWALAGLLYICMSSTALAGTCTYTYNWTSKTTISGNLDCLNPWGFDVYIKAKRGPLILRRLESSDGPSKRVATYHIRPSDLDRGLLILEPRKPDV